MFRSMLLSWLSLISSLFLFEITFAISITYPTSGHTYTTLGPDAVGWTWTSDDPTNITIYLVTYSNNKVINNLYGLTWPTQSGSVEITLQYPPVPGDYFTWMFYDTAQPIELDKNYLAESAHFLVQGATVSSTSTSATGGSTASATSTSSHTAGSGTVTPSPPSQTKASLSLGAVAGISVVVTLLAVALCLLGGFCWFRKKSGRRTKEIFSWQKPELESQDRAGLNDPSLPETEKIYEPRKPQATTVVRPVSISDAPTNPYHEADAISQPRPVQPQFYGYQSESGAVPTTAHEMYSESRAANPPELPGHPGRDIVPRKELPVSNEQQGGMMSSP